MSDSTPETSERDALLRKAYTQATQDLREAYPEEFATFRGQRSKELGVDWSPRLSPSEKARQDLDRLIADHPELVDRLAEIVAPPA